MPTNEEIAWLAGLIDGEGCITSQVHHRSYGDVYEPRFIMAMTHEETMDRVVSLVAVIVDRPPRLHFCVPKNPNHKHQWRIQLACKQTAQLLQRLRPYLVTKGVEADLLDTMSRLERRVGSVAKNLHDRLKAAKKISERSLNPPMLIQAPRG